MSDSPGALRAQLGLDPQYREPSSVNAGACTRAERDSKLSSCECETSAWEGNKRGPSRRQRRTERRRQAVAPGDAIDRRTVATAPLQEGWPGCLVWLRGTSPDEDVLPFFPPYTWICEQPPVKVPLSLFIFPSDLDALYLTG
ncbi:hypothetical protein HPB50_003194 [Hyalomma asiaticum]|uniref:Uncharacterized protein n=1 Tax=Hyalomma asiaticum TaxID=266040 RepID=A0ACB7S6P2_HYAAI|nr:hypothetical protein HPB50_003194 [Hyalomma asiaticum]